MTDIFTTKRLQLRQLHPSDADQVTDLVSDIDVARWLTRVPHPYTRKDADDFLRKIASDDMHFAVLRDGVLIGVISTAEQLGYWFGKPYWGQGFATEAGEAIVTEYFAREDADLISGYLVGNRGSARVLEQLVFVPTKVIDATPLSPGQTVPLQRMVLSKAAWEART